MIPNVIAVANGKGGVGKTSISANVAGMAALAGWQVLLIDLDPQGNLARDLGYFLEGEYDDEGEAMFKAATLGEPLRPVRAIRPNLDVVPGGRYLDHVEAQFRGGTTPARHIEAAIANIAEDYQLILLDCPPAANSPLMHAAMSFTRFLVIPTKADEASLDGISRLSESLGEIVNGPNPQLEALGVVRFNMGTGHKRIREQTRAEVRELLGDDVPIFDAVIRQSDKAAVDVRAGIERNGRGLLVYEYEQAVLESTPWYEQRRQGHEPMRVASNVDGLASDYQQLTEEILKAFLERRNGPGGAP